MAGPGARIATGGRPASHDWAVLLAQFEADYAPHKRTIKEFCEDRNPPLPYDLTRDAFMRERRRSALGAFHDRSKPILLASQRLVMQALSQIAQVIGDDPLTAGEFALKVMEKVAEREEPNPALTVKLNVAAPPLFGDSEMAAAAMRVLTKGEKPDGEEGAGAGGVPELQGEG